MPDKEVNPRQIAIGRNIAQALGEGASAVVNVFQGGTDDARDFRNRHNMLQLVWNTWIEGVLKQSLHNEVLIELGMETRPDAVDHPWDMVMQMPDREPRLIPKDTSILDLFDRTNGSLLILGEPGSGKTTMLLELCRLLIEQAKVDSLQQIPVVFNLSSWKPESKMKPEQTLADWLVNELRDRYSIPYKIGRHWIENDALTLLLDGLDEVGEDMREKCIQSINAFQLERGMLFAVGSRSQEYYILPLKLDLRGAVLIQPLSNQQVLKCFEDAGVDYTSIHRVIQEDPELQDFVHTPLLLNILMLAYQDVTEEDFRVLQGAADYRKHLFSVYIAQMFKRRSPEQNYSPDEIQAKLSWVARQMVQRRQTIFAIEDIQPSWLPNSKRASFRLIFGMIFGLISGLFLMVHRGFIMESVWGYEGGLLEVLAWGLIGGLVSGLLMGKNNWQEDIKPTDKLIWSWGNSWNKLKVGLKGGLILGLKFGLIIGLVFGLGGDLILGLIGGQISALILWLVIGLISALIFGLIFGVFLGVISGIIGGLRGTAIEVRTSPGDGVKISLQNYFIVFLSVVLIVGLSVGIVFGLIIVPLWGLNNGLIFGMGVGLFLGLFFGMGLGLGHGGEFVIKHFISRYHLFRLGHIPWNLIDFLNNATYRIFIRRVGGGYIFIHRMLMEHFAEMELEAEGE